MRTIAARSRRSARMMARIANQKMSPTATDGTNAATASRKPPQPAILRGGPGTVTGGPHASVRWPHQREEDRLADPQAGHRHEQPIDAHANSAGRRHCMLHRRQEVLVHAHRLVVAGALTRAAHR